MQIIVGALSEACVVCDAHLQFSNALFHNSNGVEERDKDRTIRQVKNRAEKTFKLTKQEIKPETTENNNRSKQNTVYVLSIC